MTLDPKIVIISSQQPALQAFAQMGPTNPILAGAYGGWQIVTRPKRKAATYWQGNNPFTMVLDIMFTKFAQDDSVEPEIAALTRMALPVGDEKPTPVVRIAGSGLPVGSDRDWVINDLTWGATFRSKIHQFRVHQQVNVSLLEFVPPTLVVESSSVAPGTSAVRTYTVKQGDTLPKIAQRLLGDYRRWKEIATLNNLRDPNHLKVGTTLRIPKA